MEGPTIACDGAVSARPGVRRFHRLRRKAAATFAAAVGTLGIGSMLGALAPAAHAEGPGEGTPYVVTLGDSYISGEAGRWAGNTNESSSSIDALGSTAYYDNSTKTAELIPGCHRSASAEVYIGGGVGGENLACSGAKTYSFANEEEFKPGIDFYNSGGHEGQALMLERFAKSHNVKLVAVTIGGNNYNFASIVQTCVEDFLLTPEWWPSYCSEEASVTNNFTSSNVEAVTTEIKKAFENVATAMKDAGYSSSQYTVLAQDYPSPIPNGSGFRYPQKGYSRQEVGGCGFWNQDANYANSTMLPTIDSSVFKGAEEAGLSNLKEMQISSAFNGRRLCETGVGLLEEEGLTSWKEAEAVNKTEWINQVRTVTTIGGPYQIQEDLHPNYWAQMALRNCLTQAYNGGAPKGGACTISGSGLNSSGEPNMTLK
ncbi:MAG: SGNH/GDSL hydrolase family protein [Solirubrobacteraceae bacterium]